MVGTARGGVASPVLDGLSWVSSGRTGSCLWGRCQGSAPEPYQSVAVLPEDGGAAEAARSWCSCPSRRRPCKHVIGLLRRSVSGELVEQPEPDFAREARERLRSTTTPVRREASASGDAATAAQRLQRIERRRERVSAGIDELERWLADQVRSGLAGLPRAGYAHVDTVAARMVDAQAPGLAAQLRGLPGEWVGESWPTRALHHLGGVHLLAQAHRRLDDLDDELAATVRNRVGYPQAKAEVLSGPGVADTWWALGLIDTIDYQLESRRVWLRGARTGRWALWQTYAPPGRGLDASILPGMVLTTTMHAYPGAGWRALPGEWGTWEPEPLVAPADTEATVGEARRTYAAALAADPWATRCPVIINAVPVPPSDRPDSWRLRDVEGRTCALTDLDGVEPWPLVAQAQGRPISVFGEWTRLGLRALAVLPDDHGREFSQVICG